MKRILVFLCALILAFGVIGTANAYIYIDDDSNPGSEADLYQIFNDIFGINYGSSDALFIARGLADAADDWWYEINGEITATVRYAGYDQELGIEDNDGYQTVVTGIPQNKQEISVMFDANGNFMWVEKLSGSRSGVGPWYSNNTDNTDGRDHFYAFRVDDLVPDIDHAWLIAFEDLFGLGDHDYNDLVAVVKGVAPIPEPATMLLLGSGLIGLAALGRKKLFK